MSSAATRIGSAAQRRLMIYRSLCLSALLWAALPVPVAGAATAAEDQTAARLQHYLDGLTSFEAQFRQRLMDARANVAQESSGKLYLQKPGRFRWDYSQPSLQQIVSDGRNLWLYDQDLEQVTVRSVDTSLATTPAALLAGKSSVAESFTVSDAGTREGLRWVRLLPKRADTDFVELQLGFAGEELRAMELGDKLRQTTRIDFSAARRNPALDSQLFAFVAPPGVDVIGEPR